MASEWLRPEMATAVAISFTLAFSFTTIATRPTPEPRKVDGPEDAIALTAGFETGIAASIWSRALDTALGLAERLRVGTVWVNGFETDDLTVPAGGRGLSGYGRSKSLAVLDKYSDLKTTWITLNQGDPWSVQ